MNPFNQAKHAYLDVEASDQLDQDIKRVFKSYRRKRAVFFATKLMALSLFVLVSSINLSPRVSSALSEIPLLAPLVRVVSIKHWQFDRDTFHADIETPSIEGLQDLALQEALNEKYVRENKVLFDDFMASVEALKDEGGHLGVDSGYFIVNDDDVLLTIGRYVVNTVGSSSTVITYDTVDKVNSVLITLPSLFKDDAYIDHISTYLKDYMRAHMARDENAYYWVDDPIIDGFEAISPNQTFYITPKRELVISFDKYEIAPGSMGVLEFTIPYGVIADDLVSDFYIGDGGE